MANKKPTKKDFADLINTVMGQEVMNEEQLSNFLDSAKKVKDTRGTEGLLDYIQQVTNAPASKDQLKNLANNIQKNGSPSAALDFLKGEKLVSEQQLRKLHQAIDYSSLKKRKK